jgi:diguanylate cyclase (GGDEF)-like protein
VSLLQHEAGRALDPNLVPLFIQLQPTLQAEADEAVQNARRAAPVPAPGHIGSKGLTPSAGVDAFENIALAHREIYALYEIAQAMGTSLGVADTMALISSKLTKIVPWSGGALFLQQPDGETLKCRFAAGVDSPQLLGTTVRLGAGLSGWVAANRRTLVNADPAAAFEAANVGKTVLNAALVCPLYYGETFIGCLELGHTDPGHYTEDHRRLIERVAEQAGAVIHNSIVFEQTQEESLTDPLTSLPNRRSLFTHFARELSRAERRQSELALIVMDVDEFKDINDTYGHHVGDHALREVSAALQTSLRPYDLCVRYAGDEFIVLIADCSPEMAEAKRLELQERIATITIPVHPGHVVRLSASAGAAVYPHDGVSYDALVADADRRMYRDKANRRARLGNPLRRDQSAPVQTIEPPHAASPASGTATPTPPIH